MPPLVKYLIYMKQYVYKTENFSSTRTMKNSLFDFNFSEMHSIKVNFSARLYKRRSRTFIHSQEYMEWMQNIKDLKCLSRLFYHFFQFFISNNLWIFGIKGNKAIQVKITFLGYLVINCYFLVVCLQIENRLSFCFLKSVLWKFHNFR